MATCDASLDRSTAVPAAPAAGRADRAWVGIALLATSALISSTAGLFTGAIAADAWTIVFWRGLVGGSIIAAWIVVRDRRRAPGSFLRMGRPGLLVCACSAVATICFINALRLTSVADVTIIFATAPFLAAALAWAWTAERPSRRTVGASLLALAGVALMVGADTAGGLAGHLLALAMTGLLAAMMVAIRRHRATSMLPASCLSAFVSAALVLPVAQPAVGLGIDLVFLLLFGAQFGLTLLTLTMGSRLVSAPRAALLGNLELPLAPVLVWLAFGAVPAVATVLGGAIVAAAILWDLGPGRPPWHGRGKNPA